MSLNKLHPRLQDFVKENWADLTPIQNAAFDTIYQGSNCIIEAPTSGGKTEAVLFPLLTRIAPNKTTGFKVLYIAPLKALLNDLALRVIPYAEKCYLKAFKWHGDVSQGDKIKQMIFPSDILLATPESIEAILLRRANWAEVFRDIETIVIDEAHYFALTDRGSHLLCLLQRIESELKKQPQRIAVTATIGNPGDLLTWLIGNNANGKLIQVPGKTDKERDFMIHYFEDEGVELHNSLYRQLINKKSIVFERSRTGTEDTATKINERNQLVGDRNPVKVKTHHSSVSKRLREEAEGSIKQNNESSLNAIISTSTLELGIDIGHLDQVIQIGGLNSSGSFLQRVGRTGRRSGQSQYFRGLCSEPDEMILLTACVSLGIERVSEDILFPKRAFHILAHQIICLCLQKMGTTTEVVWSIVSKAACFSKVSRNQFETLIDFMIKEDFLRSSGGQVLLTSNKTESEFLRANWKRLFAIFDTGPMYNVVDGKKVIGTLDSGFARARELPFVFVLGGLEWKATKIDHELQQVSVQKNETGIAPKWKGVANFDVPFELAQEVGRLLVTDGRPSFLDANALNILQMERNIHNALNWQQGKWVCDVAEEGNIIYLWTFSGEKINRVLVILLSTILDADIDYDYKQVKIDFKKGKAISVEELQNLISSFKSKSRLDLEAIALEKIQVKWFSKFSDCLPDSLAQLTIFEKDYDLTGMIRELNTITINELTDKLTSESFHAIKPL
jgi:ATP-dependent Lhr-like helicase